MSMTTALVIGLTLFAIVHQKDFDLTAFTPYLYVISFATGATGILLMATNANPETNVKIGFDI